MAISFGSINTGLPKDIVQQIIKAERIPIDKMQENKEKLSSKNALVLELEKHLQNIAKEVQKNKTARNLKELRVDTNENIIDVVTDKNIASTGEYQFEVVRLAQKSSAITTGFSDKDRSYIGVGFIQYYLPDGTSKDLYIDSDNATLTKVAQLINAQDDIGMKANVVDDGSGSDTPYRLILSLAETGDNKKAEFPYFYFVDGDEDFYIDKEREAQDAVVKLDGFEIETPNNVLTNIIQGVTIDLKRAAEGEEFTIKITEDVEAITEKVKKIIDSINGVLTFIQTQNNIDATTDTSRTLGGDSILQSLETRLRRVLFNPIKTDYGDFRANDIGIKFTRDGTIEFNHDVFHTTMANNYHQVSQILTGRNHKGRVTTGLMEHLQNFADSSLRRPNGIIHTRKQTLRSNMDQIDRRIEQRERMLEQKEKNLRSKFARLEATIARLRSQEAGVASLGAAPTNLINQIG